MQKPITFHFESNIKKELNPDVARVRLVSGKQSLLIREGGFDVLEIGVGGEIKDMTRRQLVLLARRIVSIAKAHHRERIHIDIADFSFSHLHLKEEELMELVSMNMELANFEFVMYKSEPKEGWKFLRDVFVTGCKTKIAEKAFLRGQIIAKEINACRSLANTPGGEMTPALLGDSARNAVRGLPVKIAILGEREIKKLGMGGVLGVSRGSDEKPRFIILEYYGAPKSKRPIVFVGKGVTFDTGGLNLKPSDAIYEMHMDMSGGAAVIHAVVLAARLGVRQNVVGLIPAVENMPSGSSYHPGDVLTSLSGRTIEVLNTDAEGRIILADAITYAKRYKPQLVVDVATLTGAAMSALGQRCSAIFTEDEKLEHKLRVWGEESGDYVWPLPLWEEYADEVTGTFGDIANVGKTRYGGAITAAKFLHVFAKDLECPWVHIDMAPRMTSIDGEHLAKGAVGAPVRLLLKILEHIKFPDKI